MKWMAIGEVGAFLLGLASAIFFALSVEKIGLPTKILAFVVIWFFATKTALRLVHLGYKPKVSSNG